MAMDRNTLRRSTSCSKRLLPRRYRSRARTRIRRSRVFLPSTMDQGYVGRVKEVIDWCAVCHPSTHSRAHDPPAREKIRLRPQTPREALCDEHGTARGGLAHTIRASGTNVSPLRGPGCAVLRRAPVGSVGRRGDAHSRVDARGRHCSGWRRRWRLTSQPRVLCSNAM